MRGEVGPRCGGDSGVTYTHTHTRVERGKGHSTHTASVHTMPGGARTVVGAEAALSDAGACASSRGLVGAVLRSSAANCNNTASTTQRQHHQTVQVMKQAQCNHTTVYTQPNTPAYSKCVFALSVCAQVRLFLPHPVLFACQCGRRHVRLFTHCRRLRLTPS